MGDATIAALLAARAEDDNVALRLEDASWTWREVVAESEARARWMRATVDPGRPPHVGVLLENVPEYVFLLGGAALAGAVVVGINPTRRGEELARDIRHTDCQLVVTDSAQAALLDGLDLAGAPVVLIDDQIPFSAQFRSSVEPNCAVNAGGADALYLLIFTSGSTGAPKAVQMTQGRAARMAAQGAVAFTAADVLYCSMPLFHGNALLANLFPALITGASVALRRKFSASEFITDVRQYQCTYFNYVGRALSYILAQPETPEDADNALKWCLGSEASPADRKEFRRRFGCHVIEGYSSSEGAVVITPFAGMPPNALGRPADGVDVAVVNAQTLAECPRAQFDEHGRLLNAAEAVGEIVGRDRLSSFEGYYANEAADAERGRHGWYWTGDLGYRDADGIFYFAGRTADWLRVDGENFAAGPVETVLSRFADVRGVVVYAVPDPRTGDQVMAAIELTGTFDADGFAEFLAAQSDLGTKWSPRFVRIVETIPLTATGKVDRQPLRAARWDTGDAVWWRPAGSTRYRLLTDEDRSELRRAFADAGRAAVLT